MAWQKLLSMRWQYWKECSEPAKIVMLVALAALGAVGTIRDNFFPDKDIAIINWIPPFPWYVWILGFLMLSLFFALEGGFRVQEKLREHLGNARKAELQLTYDPQLCLKMTDSNKYLFPVVVSSINDSIAGVVVSLEEFHGIERFGHLNRPFTFKHYPDNGQLTCNPGEKLSVNILFYEKPVMGNSGELQLLFQGQRATIPGEGPYTITLRATGGRALPDYKFYRIGIQNGIPFMESISS
jgi:hypothetical protein